MCDLITERFFVHQVLGPNILRVIFFLSFNKEYQLQARAARCARELAEARPGVQPDQAGPPRARAPDQPDQPQPGPQQAGAVAATSARQLGKLGPGPQRNRVRAGRGVGEVRGFEGVQHKR